MIQCRCATYSPEQLTALLVYSTPTNLSQDAMRCKSAFWTSPLGNSMIGSIPRVNLIFMKTLGNLAGRPIAARPTCNPCICGHGNEDRETGKSTDPGRPGRGIPLLVRAYTR